MSAVKTARLATAEGTPDTYSSLPQEPRLTCISHHMCPQHICAPQPSDKPHTCMPCTDTTSNTHISLLTYTHTYIMHALHLQITLTHTRLTQIHTYITYHTRLLTTYHTHLTNFTQTSPTYACHLYTHPDRILDTSQTQARRRSYTSNTLYTPPRTHTTPVRALTVTHTAAHTQTHTTHHTPYSCTVYFTLHKQPSEIHSAHA